ncbi:GTPase-activating protein-like protein of the rho/rac family [Teratosphaeria nubilosa]|uniref:GTPase-activating protein-like protein of the rho/rac family n=1 Tax=Teratosphaeria nubilosa TaxID=161662 RepID=A0A6G1LK34_9PEZI|nr:GTPase-activating protein-like protein of the rho/rac family [Teratosphaeria nubilosa]
MHTDQETATREPSSQANGQSNLPHRGLDQGAPTSGRSDRERAGQGDAPEAREKGRSNGGRRPSAPQRTCGKCQQHLTGQFVRALGDTYHLECFTCHDCDKIVASKFFPVPDQPPNQYPLCETDYFRRLDLLCYACGGALRGSYITALDRKYHIEHFTCSVCPTVFGAQDSYYEHEGSVYCHYHYSTQFAQKCCGCDKAILKQFVEIFRNGVNQHWHPECYMIHKYWNVRLHAPIPRTVDEEEAESEDERRRVREEEESVEYKVHWIWQTLSTFEERSATCISDMLLHVSNGAYMDGVVAAKKFITHVDLLFSAADELDHRLQVRPGKGSDTSGVRTFDAIVHPGLSYSREAKLLCKKVVAFFQLLAESQDTGVRRLGVTQELLSLVTGLAHYLKLMIRICLSGALKLERETQNAEGLESFLSDIAKLDDRLDTESQRDANADAEFYVDKSADTCMVCDKAVEDKCFRREQRVLHTQCLQCCKCGRDYSDDSGAVRWSERDTRVYCDVHASPDARSGGFVPISRLQQYVHLLRVAHARLLATLRTSGALPHTSDDPNLAGYDSREGHTPSNEGSDPPGLLARANTRSKSYAGRSGSLRQQESTYEDAMGDIRRLRSTRMDKQISNAGRQARTSRILGGPEGMRPGSADGAGQNKRRTGTFQIVEDRDANGEPISQLTFGRQDTMTLDDIPRIVQAQQTREQRPNATRYARNLMSEGPQPKLINGHTRDFSDPNVLDKAELRPPGTKRYFSELTALEYFIVRHVAVLSLEPLLAGHFNQEELLDLIETKRPTFWSKFGKAFAPKEKKQPKGKRAAIFGIPLEDLIERDYEESTDGVGPGSLKVPSLVQEAVSAMKTMDMSVEGVFRKNGNIKRLNDVKEIIDNKGIVDVDLTKENAVQVAALLKKFLRELPDPLLTYKLHDLWITSQRIDDSDRRRRVLHLTCCLLPKAHRDTMEVLFTFLNWVSSFSHVDEESGSKMDIHNLATVITPNVLHRGKDTVPVDDSFLGIEAVASLIECNESMCEVPEDLALILNDSSLFSNSADITTKEILKRYGDRAKAPTITTQHPGAPSANNGTTSPAPVATRVDTDPHMQTAWQNESSVRHVGSDRADGHWQQQPRSGDPQTPPNLPYTSEGRNSQDNQSPNRSSMRGQAYDKQRVMGMA